MRASVEVPVLSVAERVARGRAARAKAPRASHASFEPSAEIERMIPDGMAAYGRLFSKAYSERNERDYNALASAVSSGAIAARPGL